ncbi:uncharacterized protein LOC112906405 [Agrilus planipennis]|uniref:Uncharacterized protein LOC112906405 n=1 Tax=Agrilus planipennis TaxID=224129 RepID=A0A7F5RJW5_AGRPL|nr:uncharacterized protein LOC112906405 [Agrilus planipennis]
MSGGNVVRKLATRSNVKHPELLTSTRFRKHIATTLQLMSLDETEIEQIATFMGHTKKTHAEFYRLPQDIYQTAKVAKVLMLLEKGKANEFKGKSLGEIHLSNDVYYSSESDECDLEESVPQRALNRISRQGTNNSVSTNNEESTLVNQERQKEKPKGPTKQQGRVKWCEKEKKIVLKYFSEHIKKKIPPKKQECEEFLKYYNTDFQNKDWVKIKTYVYNVYRKEI